VLLSVCVVTYNRAHYLEELLESINATGLVQKEAIELVILDNGSDETTQSILNSWHKKLKFNLLRNEENDRGFRAYKKLIQAAQGDWVISPGDDDRFMEGGLNVVLSECGKSDENVSLIAFGASTINSEGEKTPIEFSPKKFPSRASLIAKALFESPFWMPATATRRSMINPEEVPWSMTVVDWWLWINAGLKGECRSVSQKIIEYRLHDGQEQRSYMQESWDLDRALSLSQDIQAGAISSFISVATKEELKEIIESISNELSQRDPTFIDKFLLAKLCQEIIRKRVELTSMCVRVLMEARIDPRFSGLILNSILTAEEYRYALKLVGIKSTNTTRIADLEREITNELSKRRRSEINETITPLEKKFVAILRKVRYNPLIRKIFKR